MNRGIDSQEAWFRIVVALVIASIALGAPYVATVALKQIAEEFGGQRSIRSAAISLAWLGVGVGGMPPSMFTPPAGSMVVGVQRSH